MPFSVMKNSDWSFEGSSGTENDDTDLVVYEFNGIGGRDPSHP